MSTITAPKKHTQSKPKPSRFQKLWDKAERLQRQNEQLKSRLDGLIQSAEQKIRPVEKEAAEANLPLLKKLLTLGQRKSLAKWQRGVLDDWIKDLVTDMQMFGISDDELMDDIARYDAFRMGIELDESADEESGSPYEQMSVHMKNLQREAEEAHERARAEAESDFADLKDSLEELVEKVLDERLGPPPTVPEKQSHTIDFLQDELDAELKKQLEDYETRRSALRDELMAEISDEVLDEFSDSPFDEDDFDFDDPFGDDDFDFDGGFNNNNNNNTENAQRGAPKIDNQTFHKMFRAAAARLHPDREPDPEKRLEKQQLMAELLNARKTGDLLTVFKMYQQYTDNQESFSKADEKQLLDALDQHLDQLECEKEEIIHQSPMHFTAYHQFYHVSKKKQDREIDNHIQSIRKNIKASRAMSDKIKSLKTLKPVLEDRYDQNQFSGMNEFLEEFMGGLDPADYPF